MGTRSPAPSFNGTPQKQKPIPPLSPSISSASAASDLSYSYTSYTEAAAGAKVPAPVSTHSKEQTPKIASGPTSETSVQGGCVKPDPHVSSHYACWVFDQASERASTAPGWQNETPVKGQPDAISAALVQAPMSFNSPCKMKRLFKPPFKLQITVSFRGQLDYECTASAYMLTEQQMHNLQVWSPKIHGEETMLECNTVTHRFTAFGGSSPTTMAFDLEFPELKFTQPTRMKKKYILFCMSTPAGLSLWCVYSQPTVVVSRNVDQFNKAILILEGVQPVDGRSLRGQANAAGAAAAASAAAVKALKRSSPTPDDFEPDGCYTRRYCKDYVVATYKHFGFTRALEEAEVQFLVELAKFPTPDASAYLSPDDWEAYQVWLDNDIFRSLKAVKHLWELTNPTVICSFAVLRDAIEHHLSKSLMGAFTVRPRFKSCAPASWVLSCCNLESGRPAMQHILLSAKHLQAHNLDVWVRDLPTLKYVLDIKTGAMRHKEDFFLTGYQRLNKEAEGNGNAAAAPPPPPAARPQYQVQQDVPLSVDQLDNLIPQEALDELYSGIEDGPLPGIGDVDSSIFDYFGAPEGNVQQGVGDMNVISNNLSESLNLWH